MNVFQWKAVAEFKADECAQLRREIAVRDGVIVVLMFVLGFVLYLL